MYTEYLGKVLPLFGAIILGLGADSHNDKQTLVPVPPYVVIDTFMFIEKDKIITNEWLLADENDWLDTHWWKITGMRKKGLPDRFVLA